MRRIFIIGACLLLISSCTWLMKKKEYVDLMDYRYPTDSLREPKVFVYRDIVSGEPSYRKLEAQIQGEDTYISMTSFDFRFHQLLGMRSKLTKDKITLLDASYKIVDSLPAIPMTLTRFVNDRMQPIGEYSYIIERIRAESARSGKMKMHFAYSYIKADTLNSLWYYKGHDYLRVTCINDNTYLYPSQGEPLHAVIVTYAGRSIGDVYYEEKRSDMSIRKFYLERIISLSEFEKMKIAVTDSLIAF